MRHIVKHARSLGGIDADDDVRGLLVALTMICCSVDSSTSRNRSGADKRGRAGGRAEAGGSYAMTVGR